MVAMKHELLVSLHASGTLKARRQDWIIAGNRQSYLRGSNKCAQGIPMKDHSIRTVWLNVPERLTVREGHAYMTAFELMIPFGAQMGSTGRCFQRFVVRTRTERNTTSQNWPRSVANKHLSWDRLAW